MSCTDYTERLSALLDGELPPAKMAEVTRHLAGCPDCAGTLAELAQLRAALQQEIPPQAVTPEFYAKIAALLEPAVPIAPAGNIVAFRKRSRREGAAWLVAGGAIAAMLLTALLPHHDETRDLMSVRDAALRGAIWSQATNSGEPTASGFYLTGARTDIVAGHTARILAYGGAEKLVTLCIWPANGEPAHGVREAAFKGMSIAYWNDGRQEYWAATTGPASLLTSFVTAIGKS